MTIVARGGIVVLALLGVASSAAAQAEFRAASTSTRQADDRRAEPRQTDNTQRHTETQRQTESPKPAVTQRQPEPHRQAEPRRQAEPQRQSGTSDHWRDPGPAWRPVGPAWRDTSGSTTQRPGADAFRAAPNTYAPRDGRSRRGDGPRHDDGPYHGGKRHGSNDVNVYPSYPYFLPYGYGSYFPYSTEGVPDETAPLPSAVDEEPYGFLRLRVLPRTADVFVDGSWAGTVDDFGGTGERMLRAGPHRIEIVSRGFTTLTFDVRVPANDTVTFSRELDPLDATAPLPAAVPVEIPHKALYIVPRCYIGDRPPQLSDLPAGCTLTDVRVIP